MTARDGALSVTDKSGRPLCPDCGSPIAIRNPTGNCDHLYYPDYKPHTASVANPVPDRLAPRPWRP